jgi:phosphoribosylglycinamide formyltransferase-1
MKIGIISYDYAHLKTEQLVFRFIDNPLIEAVRIYALPFTQRQERAVLIPHRPDQTRSIPTESLGELEKVSFSRWGGTAIIGDEVDLFVIAGAGILDIDFARSKPIVNAHPGIIPVTRGLDSFKWAIFKGDAVGVTLHLIDSEVDKGEILAIRPTPVFAADSLETLARRHYELELEMLANVLEHIEHRVVPAAQEKPAMRRMNAETEAEMVRKFDDWKAVMIARRHN